MSRNNGSLIKDWLVGVSTAVTIATASILANLYIDVQVMKIKLDNLEKYNELVSNMDKRLDLTNQTLEVVKETLNELKAARFRQ